MKSHHRSAEEWRSIVDRQKQLNQSDAEYSRSQGLGVASLRAWRAKFKNQESAGSGTKIVEVGTLGPSARLGVILPNGIRLEVTTGWPMEHLGRVADLLRSL
jgi:hypothetical protein